GTVGRVKTYALGFGVALLAACAAPPPSAPGRATPSGPSEGPAVAAAPLAEPAITILSAERANVRGALIAFDGAPQGLAWPALLRASAPRGGGPRAIVAAPRSARMIDVLRVAWPLRDAGVEVQTLGAANELRAVVLDPRPTSRAEGPTCHAAVLVAPDG